MTQSSSKFKQRAHAVREAIVQPAEEPGKAPSFLLNKLPAQSASNDADVKEAMAWTNVHPWMNVHPWRN